MKWLGTMLHLMYPPRYDAHAAELARLLTDQHAAVAVMQATRVRLERRASREVAIDSLAEDRG